MKSILNILSDGKQKVAILVDPDKMNTTESLKPLLTKIQNLKPNFILVGGSTVSIQDFENCIKIVKVHTDIPIIIFPGSHLQISPLADGILFLSLISGRNPDFLIGHQVEAAPILKKMKIETIPTGYILIDGGRPSAVAYVSQTTPIPNDQISIAVNTAITGEMLGLKAIFLDAGSGAKQTISAEMISAIRKNIASPIIVGGGIRTTNDIKTAFSAGADLVVIGNKIEEDEDFLFDIQKAMSDPSLINKN